MVLWCIITTSRPGTSQEECGGRNRVVRAVNASGRPGDALAGAGVGCFCRNTKRV